MARPQKTSARKGRRKVDRESRNRRIGPAQRRGTGRVRRADPANAAERVVVIRAFSARHRSPLSSFERSSCPDRSTGRCENQRDAVAFSISPATIADFFRVRRYFIRTTGAPWASDGQWRGDRDGKSPRTLRAMSRGTVKIDAHNTGRCCTRVVRPYRGKVARKFCGAPCRPRVENDFDLERTRRVILLFGNHFMLVPSGSRDGVRRIVTDLVCRVARNAFAENRTISSAASDLPKAPRRLVTCTNLMAKTWKSFTVHEQFRKRLRSPR